MKKYMCWCLSVIEMTVVFVSTDLCIVLVSLLRETEVPGNMPYKINTVTIGPHAQGKIGRSISLELLPGGGSGCTPKTACVAFVVNRERWTQLTT